MKKKLIAGLLIFCLVSCGKSKQVLLYDETKVAKKDVVVVNVPNDIEIVKIDGKNIETPWSTNGFDILLASGTHTFIAKYYCMWKAPSGENNLLKSSKFTFEANLESNKSYQIGHKPINNYEQALAMEKSPQFFLKETSLQQTNESSKEELKMEPKAPVEDDKTKQNEDKKSLTVLKLIWENSSEDDKKEFLKWLEKEKK